ncbi:MAG: Smr/MutS family protein, partial [Pseudomonadota bacterium]
HKVEYYEERRILTDITGLIAGHGDAILADLALLEKIDVIHARALFSRALDAAAPAISAQGILELRKCRHPILLARFIEDKDPEANRDEKAPCEAKGRWEFNGPGTVPVDILKGRATSTLIITGANAGGKTVAMKTLGLFVLMAQAGMHIPVAAGSSITVYDSVFADIGDEQNIEASLSTFSAHMGQINSIVSHVTPSSLVLFDELGSGTDPAEGGALAVAILDYLRKTRCFIAVTTHLNILKTYAYSHADVENVSVAFDPATLTPTYSLVYGVPGISNAIAIARNIGIPAAILTQAEQYLAAPDKQITQLISGLEQKQRDLAEEKTGLQKIKSLAAQYLQAAESLLESMKIQKEKILKNFETNARKLLRESEEELMKLIKDQKKRRLVRPDEDFKQAEDPRGAFAGIKKKLHDQFPEIIAQREMVDHLEVGQAVQVFHLKKTGTVISVDNHARKAEVAVGSLKIKTVFDELASLPDKKQPAVEKKSPEKHCQGGEAAGGSAVKQVNVVGMRVDDALPVVDKTIDNAMVQGAETVEIIHGRGTGRLMNAIREHLKGHQYVSRFEGGNPSEGGSGLTIVHIK